MSLLNRPAEFNGLYDDEGRLQGGLSSLEELAQVIAIGTSNEADGDGMDDDDVDDEPPHEFPVSNASHRSDSPSLDSDDDMNSDDMEDVAMYEEPIQDNSPLPETPLERYPSASLSDSLARRHNSSDSDGSTTRPRSSSSRRSVGRRSSTMGSNVNANSPMVLGERLKKKFLDTNVASTLLVSLPISLYFTCRLTVFVIRTSSSTSPGITSSTASSMTLSTRS